MIKWYQNDTIMAQPIPASDRSIENVETIVLNEESFNQFKEQSSFQSKNLTSIIEQKGRKIVCLILIIFVISVLLAVVLMSANGNTANSTQIESNQIRNNSTIFTDITNNKKADASTSSAQDFNEAKQSSHSTSTTLAIQQPTKSVQPKKDPQPKKESPGKPIPPSKQQLAQALEKFNPWDMSVTEKQALLKKYKSMPRKNPNESSYMPIVQNYDQQIKPIIDEMDKIMQVIKYSQTPMSGEERENYNTVFQTKLKKRLIQKNNELKQQSANNAKGDFSLIARIKKKQWYQVFQYHALVGVDLNKNKQAKEIADQEIKIFEEKYQISKYTKELPTCIVTPSYNNVDHDRYLWTLETILQQNYTNYRIVIIDDNSPDKTGDYLAKHLKWRNVSQDQFILVKSSKKNGAMKNTFYGIQKYCKLGEIHYLIDGDDELVGRQVFKVMNAMYQKEKSLTMYTTHVAAKGTMDNPSHFLGISKNYVQSDIDNNNFRHPVHRGYHHMRTMMSDVALLVRPQSLQDQKGKFYWTIADNAYYFSAMELSCRLVKYLPELFYLYNYNTGQTDDEIARSKQAEYNKVFRHINNQKSYRCLALQFKEISEAKEN